MRGNKIDFSPVEDDKEDGKEILKTLEHRRSLWKAIIILKDLATRGYSSEC